MVTWFELMLSARGRIDLYGITNDQQYKIFRPRSQLAKLFFPIEHEEPNANH
jgi:hypothetical protein